MKSTNANASKPKEINALVKKNVKEVLRKTEKIFFQAVGNIVIENKKVCLIDLSDKWGNFEKTPESNAALFYLSSTDNELSFNSDDKSIGKKPVVKVSVFSKIAENTLPAVLIYASSKNPNDFFFRDLRNFYEHEVKAKMDKQKSFTVEIFSDYKFSTKCDNFFQIIKAKN